MRGFKKPQIGIAGTPSKEVAQPQEGTEQTTALQQRQQDESDYAQAVKSAMEAIKPAAKQAIKRLRAAGWTGGVNRDIVVEYIRTRRFLVRTDNVESSEDPAAIPLRFVYFHKCAVEELATWQLDVSNYRGGQLYLASNGCVYVKSATTCRDVYDRLWGDSLHAITSPDIACNQGLWASKSTTPSSKSVIELTKRLVKSLDMIQPR